MLITYDSPAELAKDASRRFSTCYDTDKRWGRITIADAAKRATLGDNDMVARMQKYMDTIAVPVPESRMMQTLRGPIGTHANMGEWLAGSPDCMRRRVRRPSKVAPVKIIVSVTTSAAVNAATIERRGATILTLLLAMQSVRPVELYTLFECHGAQDGWHYQLTRIESRPLAVSVAAFALCHDAYQRRLSFRVAVKRDAFNGGWADDHYSSDIDARRRQRLNLGADDLLIGSLQYDDPLIENPKVWVEAQVAKWTEVEA